MAAKHKRIHWTNASPVVRQISRSTSPPHYHIPRRWFAERIVDFDLWLICDGHAELRDGEGRSYELTRGSVVWLVPGCDFEMQVMGSGTFTNIYVHFDLLDPAGQVIPCAEVNPPPAVGFIYDLHYFESTLQRIMFLEYQNESGGEKNRGAIQTLTSTLLKGLLLEYQLSQSGAVLSAKAGIRQHHAQMVSSAMSWLYLHSASALSAADLAEKFGYSQRHFCRIFRQIVGKTPGQALIEARIDHAKKLLATSALNVTEIADSLNYENVFYFSRQFKQCTSLTPVEFRNRVLSAAKSPAQAGMPMETRSQKRGARR